MHGQTELWADTVGSVPVHPSAYATCITKPCPRCGCDAYTLCINPQSGRSAKAPCLQRIKN